MTPSLRAAMLTAVVALAAVATAGAQGTPAPSDAIFLYQRTLILGQGFAFSAPTARFPVSFDNIFNSAVVNGNGIWLLYSEPNFQGTVSVLARGRYLTPTTLGLESNSLSSIRPLPAPSIATILIFQDPGYRGQMVQFIGAAFDLGFYGFNDRASSAIVLSGTWRLFDGVRYTGLFKDLRPGYYPRAGGDNRLTSLSPI